MTGDVTSFPKPNKRRKHGYQAENVVEFLGTSRIVESPKRVLNFALKDDFDEVVVLGVKDGLAHWRTSHGKVHAMFLMEQARRWMTEPDE